MFIALYTYIKEYNTENTCFDKKKLMDEIPKDRKIQEPERQKLEFVY